MYYLRSLFVLFPYLGGFISRPLQIENCMDYIIIYQADYGAYAIILLVVEKYNRKEQLTKKKL